MKKIVFLVCMCCVSVAVWSQVRLYRKQSHIEKVVSVSFAPDSKHFVSVDDSALAIIWDVQTGAQLMVIRDVVAAKFAPDDSESIYLVMGNMHTKKVDLTGKTIKNMANVSYSRDWFRGYTFYPESNILLAGHSLMDINTGNMNRLNEKEELWSGSDFSPALNLLAVQADRGRKLYFYDVKTRERVREMNMRKNSEPFSHVTFSPRGDKIAYYSNDTLQVRETATGKLLYGARMRGMASVSFTADAQAVLVLTPTEVMLFDLVTRKPRWKQTHDLYFEIGGHEPGAALSPDGKTVAVVAAGGSCFINAATGAITKRTVTGFNAYKDLAFTADGTGLMTIRIDEKRRESYLRWDLVSGTMQKIISPKLEEAAWEWMGDRPFLPASDGKSVFFMTALTNPKTRAYHYWSIRVDENGKEIDRFDMSDAEALELSFDNRYMMARTRNLCKEKNADELGMQVFDVKTHKPVFTLPCNASYITMGKSHNWVAVKPTWFGKRINIHELPSGKLIRTIPITDTVGSSQPIVFSPDDKYLVMEGNKRIIVLNIETGQEKVLRGDLDFKGFTSDSKYLVIANDGYKFYDLQAGKYDEKKALPWLGYIRGMAFGKDPNYMFFLNYDGEINVFDLQSKQVKALLYPSRTADEWAVIAPNGQFDAPEKAQASMFHVSGKDVVPLDAMSEKFYTPRLLPRVLSGEDFSPVPDLNKLKPVPLVQLSYKEGNRNLTVEDAGTPNIETKNGSAVISVKADCPADGVTEIRLYQNGKLVQTTRNLTVEDETKGQKSLTRAFTVALSPGNNLFKAIALNTERTESKPATLVANYTPDANQPKNVSPETAGMQLHLIVVGINNYKNTRYNLNYATADATAFRAAIENGANGLFTKVNTTYIENENASKTGINAAFEKVKAAANPQDLFVFYYAGHGVMNDKKEFFLVPYDVTQLYGNDGVLNDKGVSASAIQQFSKDIRAQKQLFVLDACQSAAALSNVVAMRGAAEEKAIAQLARSTGTHWLAASGSEQFAAEFSQLGHGSFTYCLLEALKGSADNGDRKITVKELDSYLQNRVPEITQKYRGAAQYPASSGYGNDFPVIVVK